jgi:primase-polymerase (primpol)-like protein
MTSLRRWVRWRPVQRNGRWTKLPVQASGRAASSTDPRTWTSFDEAAAGPARRIGFVLGAGIGCIDLDHCLIDGRPNEATRDLLAMMPETWIEVSPSGDGLHVWGQLPEGAGRVSSFNGQSVEIYSAGRYITVTGNRWAGSPAVLADLSGAAALV